MSKSFAAPSRIRRITARRVFKATNGKPVVLTLGVPEPVPGSDWGCALQITGLETSWRRPRYVFGIDGLQAIHLAMKCATEALASAEPELEWLGEKGELMLPKFLPDLPKREQDRLEALMERETRKYVKRLERAYKAKTSKARKRPSKGHGG